MNEPSRPRRQGDRITTFFIAVQNVRFSNRPAGVKRFQAIRGSDGNVARGLVLLYGLGTQAGPS